MNIENLLSIIKSENKEFLKDYYDQVKSGISDSNSKMWKFIIFSGLIVICYFLFSQKIIANVKLSLISLDNPEIISLLTPPLFSLCYLVSCLHAIRHRNLLIQYKLLNNYFGGIKRQKDEHDFTNYVLPVNFVDSIFDIFASVNSKPILIFNLLLSIPFFTIQILAFIFIFHCVIQIWDIDGIIYWSSKILTIWMAVIVLITSGIAQWKSKENKFLIKLNME
ncbi:hypothetical protein [Labilibaculum manganireducens]|uniref:hypothetical protein n=1 Tax=Labilibaculum manganireducens TaxID=1940525 RepID=UPI0029F55B8C|nr:hypothetical protein [Labilibaculum manganireducens]